MEKNPFKACRTASFKEAEALKLPTPRLQFRWEPIDPRTNDGYRWRVHYELVMKLGQYDVRNPREYKEASEYAMTLGGQMTTAEEPDKGGKTMLPFRDGAHATWDAMQLNISQVWSVLRGVPTDFSEEYAEYVLRLKLDERKKEAA